MHFAAVAAVADTNVESRQSVRRIGSMKLCARGAALNQYPKLTVES
jgi:hypothetical protein